MRVTTRHSGKSRAILYSPLATRCSPMFAFAGNPLDRASEKRSDSAWLAAARADPALARASVVEAAAAAAGARGQGALDRTRLCRRRDGERSRRARCGGSVPGRRREDRLFRARHLGPARSRWRAALAGLGHFRDARAAASLLPLRPGGDHGPSQGSARLAHAPRVLQPMRRARRSHPKAVIAACVRPARASIFRAPIPP